MMLGNLSVSDMEGRLGITFPEPFRSDFSRLHNPDANHIAVGKWHCFDIPFVLVCGDDITAHMVANNLTPLAKEMKHALHISVIKQ